jgi:EAL domain-containing protein (putative c-di-GMP-specific phosphodiesterase class I)
MGCDSIQGYLISRPVPEDQLHDILALQQQGQAGDGPA